jgi:hypothetical protein
MKKYKEEKKNSKKNPDSDYLATISNIIGVISIIFQHKRIHI